MIGILIRITSQIRAVIKLFLLLIIGTIFYFNCQQNANKIISKRTIANRQEIFRIELLEINILGTISKYIVYKNEADWQGVIWEALLIQYKSDTLINGAKRSNSKCNRLIHNLKKVLLEISYSPFPYYSVNEINTKLAKSNTSKLFALAVHYLVKSSINRNFKKLITEKFSKDLNDPITKLFKCDLAEIKYKPSPLIDLSNQNFGKMVVYSFYRKNRNYTGITVIKTAEGNFITKKEIFFSIPHLARSVTDIPSYITNGNTPEGIFSIQGIDVPKNVFISPTPNLKMIIPFERKPDIFFNNKDAK